MSWQRKPRIPKGYQDWPADAVGLSTQRLIQMYNSGFAGAKYDPEAREALYASLPEPDGEKVAMQYGLAESGAGKLSIPFIYSHQQYPKCWPCPGQETGDCVGHGGKNAIFVLCGVECALEIPDEVTGLFEGWPVVSDRGEDNGVFAFEPIYGDRGHGGQGASCDRLIQHVTSWGGAMLRQNYPEIDLDLTDIKTSVAIGWGRSQTPENVRAIAKQHQVRSATDCSGHEVVRDFVHNGFPIWVCSGYGWSSQRDENGYSKRSGSWSHSWIIMGYDDRDVTKQKYGFPLALYNHDWGIWNEGGRRILGTDIDIPEGSMWIDARLLDNCDCTAMAGFTGFRRQALPDLGFSGF